MVMAFKVEPSGRNLYAVYVYGAKWLLGRNFCYLYILIGGKWCLGITFMSCCQDIILSVTIPHSIYQQELKYTHV